MARLPKDPASAEITPEAVYLRRREFLKNAALYAGTAAAVGGGLVALVGRGSRATPAQADGLPPLLPAGSATASPYSVDEPRTRYEDVTTYNNFYEFGLGKSDPSENAGTLRSRPWTIRVEGEVKKPKTFDIDALLSSFGLEERVYRMRCVEAWSMVIPWLGFPLAALL